MVKLLTTACTKALPMDQNVGNWMHCVDKHIFPSVNFNPAPGAKQDAQAWLQSSRQQRVNRWMHTNLHCLVNHTMPCSSAGYLLTPHNNNSIQKTKQREEEWKWGQTITTSSGCSVIPLPEICPFPAIYSSDLLSEVLVNSLNLFQHHPPLICELWQPGHVMQDASSTLLKRTRITMSQGGGV